MGNIEVIENNDWSIFVETGNVDILIIKRIALKMVLALDLSMREEAIRIEKHKEVEKHLLILFKQHKNKQRRNE